MEKRRVLIYQWRKVLVSIKMLNMHWDAFRKSVLEATREEIDYLPVEAQKGITKWGKGLFHKIAPDMIAHLWATGGIDEHLNALKVEEPAEKKEKANGIT